MKMILVAAVLFLFSVPAIASGPYDGIWYFHPYAYSIVTERNNELVVVTVYTNDYGGLWTASQGKRTNNKGRLTQIVGVGNSVIDIEAINETTVETTQVSCSVPVFSGYYCLFPNGYKMTGIKVW